MASALSFGDSIPGADLFSGKGFSFGSSSNIGGAFSAFGGAAQDLFASKGAEMSAAGSRRAAAGMRQAAGIATENLGYEEQSIGFKMLQADRSIFQSISSAEANISGNGLKASGSGLDILRDSANQGELTKTIVGLQGQIDLNGIRQQIASFGAQADQYDIAAEAADNSSTGSLISGLIKGAAGVAQAAMFFSDRRLKENIVRVGETSKGIPMYEFNFLGDSVTRTGPMADEVHAVMPEAVLLADNGFLMVDYNMIGA